MDELKKLRLLTIFGSIVGTIGIVLLFLGSGYDKYTGYSEDTGIPYMTGIGFVFILAGGFMLGYKIKKKK